MFWGEALPKPIEDRVSGLFFWPAPTGLFFLGGQNEFGMIIFTNQLGVHVDAFLAVLDIVTESAKCLAAVLMGKTLHVSGYTERGI